MPTRNRIYGWLLVYQLIYLINVLASSSQCEQWGYILIA
jgi:hypothetical protein